MEKWKLFHEISSFLDKAPVMVSTAWRAGWTNITHYPNGFSSMDSCGCCSTDHAPGWYGYPPRSSPWNERKRICGSSGESVTNSSVVGGMACCTDH